MGQCAWQGGYLHEFSLSALWGWDWVVVGVPPNGLRLRMAVGAMATLGALPAPISSVVIAVW